MASRFVAIALLFFGLYGSKLKGAELVVAQNIEGFSAEDEMRSEAGNPRWQQEEGEQLQATLEALFKKLEQAGPLDPDDPGALSQTASAKFPCSGTRSGSPRSPSEPAAGSIDDPGLLAAYLQRFNDELERIPTVTSSRHAKILEMTGKSAEMLRSISSQPEIDESVRRQAVALEYKLNSIEQQARKHMR